ncbi:MAG: hypothetical protein RR630_02510 [Coprobacillus sp.]
MKKLLKYIFMIIIGITLSMFYLRIADTIVNLVMSEGMSFTIQGVSFLITIIIYIAVIFPAVLILLDKINKRLL